MDVVGKAVGLLVGLSVVGLDVGLVVVGLEEGVDVVGALLGFSDGLELGSELGISERAAISRGEGLESYLVT